MFDGSAIGAKVIIEWHYRTRQQFENGIAVLRRLRMAGLLRYWTEMDGHIPHIVIDTTVAFIPIREPETDQWQTA
ncbi:MAG: hypothetical protein KAX65_00150 [Caldilineaceae bacterium]|nr:hypothetical protein [Caldilineaceae bacterium]